MYLVSFLLVKDLHWHEWDFGLENRRSFTSGVRKAFSMCLVLGALPR